MGILFELEELHENRQLRERSKDYVRGVEKTDRFLRFVFFYGFVFVFGIFGFGMGCFMAFTGSPWWGHTLFELVIGAGFILFAVPAFINDTVDCFDSIPILPEGDS